MKKTIDAMLSFAHLIVASSILILSRLVGEVLSSVFQVNTTAKSLAAILIYLVLAIVLGVFYAKTTAHISCRQLGMVKRFPDACWLVIGILLPFTVMGFYLFFADGEIVKGSVRMTVLCSTAITAVSYAVVEEVLFRGLLLRAFLKTWNTEAAVMVPSVLCAALQVILQQPLVPMDVTILLVSGTLAGTMFSLIALSSGSLWASILVHALWDMIMLGGTFALSFSGSDWFLYKCILSDDSLLFLGGAYGMECTLPAVAGYVSVSAAVLCMSKKQHKAVLGKQDAS